MPYKGTARDLNFFPLQEGSFEYRYLKIGRDSSVGIATRYMLDGPGIESRLGRYVPNSSRPALGTTQPSTQWVPALSRGKAGGGVA